MDREDIEKLEWFSRVIYNIIAIKLGKSGVNARLARDSRVLLGLARAEGAGHCNLLRIAQDGGHVAQNGPGRSSGYLGQGFQVVGD